MPTRQTNVRNKSHKY